MTDGPARREFLRTSGALASTAVIGGIAGCFGGHSGGDGGDESKGPQPAFALGSWLPQPGTVTAKDHYSFEFFSYDRLLSAEMSLKEGAYSEMINRTNGKGEQPWPLPSASGRPIDTLSEYVSADNNSQQVLYGNHAPKAIGDGLVKNLGFERAGEYRKYDLFRTELQQQSANIAIGVSDYVMLWIQDESAVEAIKTLADTQTGQTPVYADGNDDFVELFEHVEGGDRVLGETSEPVSQTNLDAPIFEGEVGYGYKLRLDGDPIDETYAIVFEDESAVDADAVEQWVAENESDGRRFAPHTSVSIEQDGRTVLVSGSREQVDPFVDLFD